MSVESYNACGKPLVSLLVSLHALFVAPMPYTLLSGNQNNHIEVFHVILHGKRYVVAVAMLMIFYL